MAVKRDALEGLAVGMRGGEGYVATWVPVLGRYDVAKQADVEQAGDAWHGGGAVVAGQRASGHEVRLHVDNDQCGVFADELAHGRSWPSCESCGLVVPVGMSSLAGTRPGGVGWGGLGALGA